MAMLRSAGSRRTRFGVTFTTAAIAATLMLSLFAGPVAARSAAVVHVGCRSGVGDTSKLIKSIKDANQRPRPVVTILYLADCTYTLHGAQSFPSFGPNGLPTVTSHLVIRGQGATIRRGTGAGRFRLIGVGATGVLKLVDLTLTNGAARNGQPGSATLGGNGTNGTKGDDGGAIYNQGRVGLTNVILADNYAGKGGAGGAGVGLDAADGASPGANGDDASNVEGGWGGNGGDGGAIYNAGTLTIKSSTLQNNYAGDGGLGGEADGGKGGDGAAGAPGGNGGYGGGATGGQGGDGGRAGAIFSTGTLTVNDTTIDSNYAGNGADVGTAVAGMGGHGADDNGVGGHGGGANSWFSGSGGEGGAVYLSSGVANFTNDTISNNVAGDSGNASATGGAGGDGGCSGTGGSGGGSVASAGPAGAIVGIVNDGATLHVTSVTFTGGAGGVQGGATSTGGVGGAGGSACV